MISETIPNYELEEQIGKGAFTTVFRARHKSNGEIRAIKIANDEKFATQLKKESALRHNLQREDIVKVYDVDLDNNPPYIVMEYVGGKSLDKIIDNKSLPFERVVPIAINSAIALDYAHKNGILHSDIKPANILTMQRNGNEYVKLTDFGLGRSVKLSSGEYGAYGSEEDRERIAGTLAYMAPEVLVGKEPTIQSDIYSFGATFYEMLTGVKAIENYPRKPSNINQKVPITLDKIVMRSLERDPKNRWKSARDLADNLLEFEVGEFVRKNPIVIAHGKNIKRYKKLEEEVHSMRYYIPEMSPIEKYFFGSFEYESSFYSMWIISGIVSAGLITNFLYKSITTTRGMAGFGSYGEALLFSGIMGCVFGNVLGILGGLAIPPSYRFVRSIVQSVVRSIKINNYQIQMRSIEKELKENRLLEVKPQLLSELNTKYPFAEGLEELALPILAKSIKVKPASAMKATEAPIQRGHTVTFPPISERNKDKVSSYKVEKISEPTKPVITKQASENIEGAAERIIKKCEKRGKYRTAAKIAEEAGMMERAIQIYEKLGWFSKVAEVAERAGMTERAKFYRSLLENKLV